MYRIGDILDGTYQLVEQIGSGGVGVIYKAYHLRLQKYVVLKKIKDNFVGSINNRAEVDILKKLHHTYLPQVYDFLQIDHQVFTVMDYITGYDLKQYAAAGTEFSEDQMVLWLKQLLEVLEYLHRQKPPILHTDIKPANIMVTQEGNICLIDFNISLDGEEQIEMQGVSRLFGSPEQIRKADLSAQGLAHDYILLDERTDIYSTGVTFAYLMQRGRYSEALCNIINKACEPEVSQRYKSAAKMLAALDNIEKQGSRYKRYVKISLASRCLLGLIGVFSILSIYYGYHSMVREKYQDACQVFQRAQDAEMDSEVQEKGLEILNSTQYQKLLEKNPEYKAYILHCIGDSYFIEENYSASAESYEEALELLGSSEKKSSSEKEILYYRDLVIAQARSGNPQEALVTLAKAEQHGLQGEELLLAEGEIQLEQGDTDKALKNLSDIFTNTNDMEIRKRTGLLMARSYIDSKDEKSAVAVLEKVRKDIQDKEVLRELGTLYNAEGKNKEAYSCFAELNKLSHPTYEDQVNLILCDELLSEYKECRTKLKELLKNYPDDYRLYMYLSRVCLKQEMSEKDPDFSEAVTNYNKAAACYQKQKVNGTTDEAMEELKQWIEEVR